MLAMLYSQRCYLRQNVDRRTFAPVFDKADKDSSWRGIMSRPSSRVSSTSISQQQPPRSGSSAGLEQISRADGSNKREPSITHPAARTQPRPHSAASGSVAQARVPFTPGATSKTNRAAHLGLSAKQVDKLNQSIANARKSSFHTGTEPTRTVSGSESRVADRKGKGKASVAPDASFIAEASFVDAPLNSRLAGGPAQASTSTERITIRRLRQIITNTDEDEDNEADLQQLDDGSEPEHEVGREQLDDVEAADLAIQEALLMEDLLHVIVGVDGQFIYTVNTESDPPEGAYSGPSYAVDPQIDPSLRSLVCKITPLATYYAAIHSFIEAYSHLTFGLTAYALCSAIRSVIQEYHGLVARLEQQFLFSPDLSLQKFHVLVEPVVHQMFLIYELIQDLTTSPVDANVSMGDASGNAIEDDSSDDDDRFGGGKAMKEALRHIGDGPDTSQKKADWSAGGPVKGGEILAIIDERLQRMSGDPVALALYSTLLLKASQPYARSILRWIATGHLTDVHDEYMIKEAKSLDRDTIDMDYVDQYWERRYTLKDRSLDRVTAGSSQAKPSEGLLLDPGTQGILADRLEFVSRDSRNTKRERGLGGGAIVPSFIEPWKIKILLAGKYLNVMRECGNSNNPDGNKGARKPASDSIDFTADIDMGSKEFQARVDEAYAFANTSLLTLLIDRQALFARLRSLKHHFFMDHGDSFTHFLDLAAVELSKKAKHVSLSKLQSQLDLALRNPASASSADPYKEDVKVAISAYNLTEWLMKIVNVSGNFGTEDGAEGTLADSESKDKKKDDKHALIGIDALSLDYSVEFPLSLVISRNAMVRYQLIFRHLLSFKHLEQTLTSNWLEHTKNPLWRRKTAHILLEKWKARVFTLRSRMLAFVQQMFAFAVSEVLESNWRKLMAKLVDIKTVDHLLGAHMDFLDTCLKECMLTNPKLLRLQSKLMTTCSLFVSYNSKLTKAANSLTNATEEALDSGEDWSTVSIKQEDDFLQKFEINFYRHQKLHADTVMFHALSDTGSLVALVVRLANTVPQSEGPPTS